MQNRWRIRPYDASDFCSVARLLKEAFVSSSDASVRFSLSRPNTAAIVAELDDAVIGVAMTIRFGETAWVGSVVVSPDWRRKGVGTAVTERAVELALPEARTVLLLAVEPARAVYERLGFEDECSYGTWVLPTTAFDSMRSREASLRPMNATDPADEFAHCLELDRIATGEQRISWLEPVASAMRVVLTPTSRGTETKASGYRAQLPWGAGPIIAIDCEVAAGLVRETLAANPETRVEFPDANEPGRAVMRELGLVRVEDDYRMRLGPPVLGFHPQFIYKVLTPTVG
jgi:GNAT superfamily N-acetyltransferase